MTPPKTPERLLALTKEGDGEAAREPVAVIRRYTKDARIDESSNAIMAMIKSFNKANVHMDSARRYARLLPRSQPLVIPTMTISKQDIDAAVEMKIYRGDMMVSVAVIGALSSPEVILVMSSGAIGDAIIHRAKDAGEIPAAVEACFLRYTRSVPLPHAELATILIGAMGFRMRSSSFYENVDFINREAARVLAERATDVGNPDTKRED